MSLVLLAVLGLSIASAATARSVRRSPGWSRVSWSKSRPVAAVPVPAGVQRALQSTQAARYVVVSESSQSGSVRYELDSLHGRAVTVLDRKVSVIQIGAQTYTPGRGGGCYVAAKRPGALLPNVAGSLLPSGIAAIRYVMTGRTIGWSVKTAHGYRPHGTVTVDRAGRIVSAVVHSGPGVPLTATVAYPAKRPRIVAPRRLCVDSARAKLGAGR